MWQMQPNSTLQPEPMGICLQTTPLAPSQPPHLVPIYRPVFSWRENKLLLWHSLEVPDVLMRMHTTVVGWELIMVLQKCPQKNLDFAFYWFIKQMVLKEHHSAWVIACRLGMAGHRAAKFHHDLFLDTDGHHPVTRGPHRLWIEQWLTPSVGCDKDHIQALGFRSSHLTLSDAEWLPRPVVFLHCHYLFKGLLILRGAVFSFPLLAIHLLPLLLPVQLSTDTGGRAFRRESIWARVYGWVIPVHLLPAHMGFPLL